MVQRAKDHMQADVGHRLSRTVAAMTASTTRHLRVTRPAIMRGVRRSRRQFEARLEPLWGDGFEKLDALVHTPAEVTESWSRFVLEAPPVGACDVGTFQFLSLVIPGPATNPARLSHSSAPPQAAAPPLRAKPSTSTE